MAEDKYRVDPTITSKIMDTASVNYWDPISKMFENLGSIELQRENLEQKKQDRELANEAMRLNIDNAKSDKTIKEISVREIQDKVADNKIISEYMASNYSDYNTWAKDKGAKLKTPEALKLVEAESDARTQKMWDESLSDHLTYLKEKNLFSDKDGNINMPEVRKQLAKDPQNFYLAQAFERRFKTPMDKPQEDLTQKDLLTEESKNALMEKKYGIKVPPKTSSANDLAVQKWLHELQKENMELMQTNDALDDVKAKYKAATGGESMTREQVLAFKKKGETPFYEYGSNQNQKKEEQVAQTLDLKETVDELANLSDEDLQRVIGFWSESWLGTLTKRATGQYSPRDRELIQKIGKLNAEQMHKLYGAALTGNEIDRAKTWNLDRDYTGDVDTFRANLKNFKEMADKAYKRNMYGVYMRDKVGYKPPAQPKTQEQKKDKPNLVEHTEAKPAVITPDQAKTFGIKFN